MKGYRIAMKLINQTKIFKFIVPIIVFIIRKTIWRLTTKRRV